MLAEEYPSGIYTWRAAAARSRAEVLTVSRERGESWTDAVLAALDERVAIVSVPYMHWTDGALLDLAAVSQRSREVGAALVIDGSQSVGAMPTDVGLVRPDFLVTVGYKWLLGPLSVGYLYVSEAHRAGEPIEENSINRAGSEDFAGLVDYQEAYQPGARRYDSGQRTKFELIPMALRRSSKSGVVGAAHCRDARRDDLRYRAASVRPRSGHSPRSAARSPHAWDRCTRRRAPSSGGRARRGRLLRGVPFGSSLRISPHLHTTDQDVERLLDALGRVAALTATRAEP